MHSFYGTRLSENMAETPEGYLICYDVNIARIGMQEYLGSELGVEDEVVVVNRPPEEVFKPATVASFEGKPFTNDHPFELLDISNTSIYEKGHIQNVRISVDKTFIIADIMVKDAQTISDIKNGKRELSAGYYCDCVQDENGNWYQCNIIGNHVALVDKGRAGNKVRINDREWNEQDHPRGEGGKFTSGGGSNGSNNEKEKSGNTKVKSEGRTKFKNKEKSMKDKKTVFGKLLKAFAKDAEPEEMVEAINAVKGEDEYPTGGDDRITKLEAQVADISAKLDKLYSAEKQEEKGEMHALDELEKEITDEDAEGEEGQEVQDEDANNDSKLIEAIAEKAQTDEDTTEEIKKEIADAKKVIAKIEDKETRLAVADSLAKVIRGKMKSASNYKKLMDASKKKQVSDTKAIDYDAVFKKIKEEKFRK